MWRKYTEDLERWNHSPNRKPLIVWGARQVGKTFLIRDIFAETHYAGRYIYVDCLKDSAFSAFCDTHLNVDEVINYLELDRGIVITKDTLLIFDEIQECLPIITMLKYFCQDHREIPVIATGSMVRVKLKRESHKPGVKKTSYMFPTGKIDEITVRPVSFEEYLANKNPILLKTIVSAYEKRAPLNDAAHEHAIKEFYNYLLVGGMPEAVNEYLETGSHQAAREILGSLYSNYLSDMELYQASPESIIRARAIFKNIYSQLNKENKNFSPSAVESKAKTRDLRSPLEWLILAQVVHKSALLKERVTIPMVEDENEPFRLYLADMGMFSYQSGVHATTFIDKTTRNTLSGIFYENFVACELLSESLPLFYWKGKSNSEFEFLVQNGNNLIPMDVKKSKGSLRSLEKYESHNHVEFAVKISENRLGVNKETKIFTVPFYSAFLLFRDFKQGVIVELEKES